MYKEHLGLTAALVILNVTTSEATMANMLKLAQEVSPEGNTYQLFQCHSQFARHFKPPKILYELLAGNWSERVINPSN